MTASASPRSRTPENALGICGMCAVVLGVYLLAGFGWALIAAGAFGVIVAAAAARVDA